MSTSFDSKTVSLIWLDNSEENHHTQECLQTINNHFRTFENCIECEKYIRSMSIHDRIVLIVSGLLGRKIIPQIHSYRQISSIYIYCFNRKMNEKWTKNFSKIEAILTKSEDLINQIRMNQNKRLKKTSNEIFPMNIFEIDQGQSTTDLNGQFVYFQLLIDCLIRMKRNFVEKNEFISLCKQQYRDNRKELNIINEFERNYLPTKAIWWYTRQTFLYRLLNQALRIQNIDLIYLFRFFIRDLYYQLCQYQCSNIIRVYRGQLMLENELDILKNSIGKYISINSFFSTSFNRNLALEFSSETNQYERVLFEIDADPIFIEQKPFADISQMSSFPNESEVLFMLGSIFHLTHIELNSNNFWTIQMSLTNGNDHHLKSIFEHMKTELNENQTDLLSFGHILRNMGKYDEAEMYYRRLLNTYSTDNFDLSRCYHALGIIAYEKGDYDSSLNWHENSLKIKLNSIESNQSYLANSYNSIGTIYERKKDYQRALESFQKSLIILEQIYGNNHPKLAICLNNIAGIYQMQKQYREALDYNKKALNIREKYLPIDHPDIGTSYSNIGIIYRCLEQYDVAITYHQQSLEIQEKSLPSKHPQIASTLTNLGLVYEDKNDCKQARQFYEKAVDIYRQTLPLSHPKISKTKQLIERISLKMTDVTEI